LRLDDFSADYIKTGRAGTTDYAGNLAGQAVNVPSWDMRQTKGGSDVSRMLRH
jgi:hypothetical protein